MDWCLSYRTDPAGRSIADRHYNRQHVGATGFVPPGRCLVLLSEERNALWVTSWPLAEFVRHAWAGAWVNSCFRREGGVSSASDLIRQAIAATLWRWPDVPPLGMVTFIDRRHVKGTKRRGKIIYGYSYLKAGFEQVGETQGGLLAFQMRPDVMPDPVEPQARDGQMFAVRPR